MRAEIDHPTGAQNGTRFARSGISSPTNGSDALEPPRRRRRYDACFEGSQIASYTPARALGLLSSYGATVTTAVEDVSGRTRDNIWANRFE